MMKHSFLMILGLATALLASCNKKDNGNREDRTCGSEVICTANFAQIMIRVQTPGGQAVRLDSFVVTDNSGVPLPRVAGNLLYGCTCPNNGITVGGCIPSDSNHRYMIINDAWVQGHQRTTKVILAKGFMNGRQVFSAPYTITTDCCHVSRTTGNTTIVIP